MHALPVFTPVNSIENHLPKCLVLDFRQYIFGQDIPFSGEIPDGLQHDLLLRIKGQMMLYGSFVVDIETKMGTILHLHIDPSGNTIVRNYSLNHEHGQEQIDGGCPIQFGQPFEILIKTIQGQFDIHINGRYFCKFLHRIPVIFANVIHVDGEVKIQSITLEHESIRSNSIPDDPLLSRSVAHVQHSNDLPASTTSTSSFDSTAFHQDYHNQSSTPKLFTSNELHSSFPNYYGQHSKYTQTTKYQSRGTNT